MKKQQAIFSVLFTLTIILGVKGTLFDKEIRKVLFNNTLKSLHRYILSFLHRGAQVLNHTHYTHIQDWLLNQLRFSTLFVKFSGQSIENTTNRSHIARATGGFISTSSEVITLPLMKGAYEHYFYLWTFYLDKMFGLNLTFINLYFSSGPKTCIAGNLSITKQLQQNNCEKEGITLCGYHSLQTVYLNYDDIQIKMSLYIDTLYHVDALFSVIDIDLVKSYTTPTLATPLSLKSYHVVKKIIIWQSYSITVNKFHHVTLSLSMDTLTKYQVHDGPGKLSSILASKYKSTFVCSTFQCYVSLFSRSVEKKFITYNSEQLLVHFNFNIINTDQIPLPLHECHSMFCFVTIQSASIQYQVNATVITFLYLGNPLDRYTCIYDGLSVTQQLYGDKESETICEKYNTLNSLKRSFYSKNSSLFLLMYWYEHYSKINLTLNVSLTKCTVVELNYCTIERTRQLSQFVEYSNFNIRYKGSWSTYLFALQNDGCVVLQFREKSVMLGEISRRCSFDLVPYDIPLPGTEITYEIMGILNQFHGGSKRANDWVFFSDNSHTEEFYSAVEPQDKLMNCLRETVYGCSSFFTYMVQSANDTDINFFVKVKSKSPTHQNTFHLNTVMPPVTNSWIDVIIWKRTTQNDMSGPKNYLFEIISLSGIKVYSQKTGNLLEYILLLTLEKNFSNVSEMENKSMQLYFRSTTNTKYFIYLTWTWQLPLSNLKVGQFISLPGKLESMSMFLWQNNLNHAENIPVKLVWIHDNYKKFSYHFNGKGRKYTTANDTSVYYSDCMSFLSTYGRHSRLNTRNYILFNMYLVQGKFWHCFGPQSPVYSWQETSQLCREIGGFLPFFRSRDDLQEMLTLLKLSEDIPPLEAIFIGLKESFGNQVEFFFYYYCLFIVT